MSERTRELSGLYSRYARAYRRTWAPVLARLARPMVKRLPDLSASTLADIACGVGAIAGSLGARTTIGADLTPGMLGFAPAGMLKVACDARRSPLRSQSADVATCTFALQHVPHPGRAISEMLRVVRPGGMVGLVTWGPDSAEVGGPYEVAERALRRARAPADPARSGYHARVDQPSKLERFARRQGAEDIDAWMDRVAYRWTPERFLDWATNMGTFARRLDALPVAGRERAVAEMREGIERLDVDDLAWRPQIVFLVARR